VHTFVIALQIICVLVVFIECMIVLRRWKRSVHTFLFMSCIALFVNCIGYLLELLSTSIESYLTALKLSYVGREWYVFFMFLFVAELTGKKLPLFVRNIIIIFNLTVNTSIFLTPLTNIYYTDISFDTSGALPLFIHGDGILHHINMGFQIIYIVIGMAWLFAAGIKSKSKLAVKRFTTVIIAVFIESLFFIIKLIGIPGLTEYYDITMIGFIISTIIMFVAIFSYDLLGTQELAKEYIIDRLSEGIIAVDNEGEVQYVNAPAKRLFPALANKKKRYRVDSDKAKALSEIKDAARNDTSITIGEHIYTPEENELIYGGEIVGKLYALVDDTEHYRYMEELEKQKDIADNANEAKSRFLANMSHEIRTPINAVLGMDEMILRESGEKHIRGYASDIMSAGKTLLSLINDILDFSKVEEGKMEIIPVQYELSSLINDLVNMIRGRADKKGLSFNISVDEKIPHILLGDEIRIKQCVLNLLTNAVKYTEKGFVNLKVGFLPAKNDEYVMLKFSVEDSGIGMKPEDIEKLFSPYKRIDEKRNRNIEGTGLGMTITRQLLELMGSSLDVKSVYGEGTSVSFEVEQKIVSRDEIGNFAGRLDEVGGDFEEYHELFHAPDARILVVDDTEMNLTVIQSLLKKTAVRVDTALSGRDAVSLCEVNKYDLVFIDHMMPDMDGVETLKAIRSSGKNTQTPAIALTANAVSGAREMYLDAGFNDYLSKPVDGSKLEKLMAGLIPKDKLLLAAPEESRDSLSTAGRSKILVIDDDESVCALIESILGNLYDISVIHTGAEAENAATSVKPDLILLDIHLGDANGFDIMRVFKENEQISDIPVLLVTGDNDTVTEENGFKVGASDYIRKPFVPDVLKQRVKRIIDLYHYQRSIEEEVEVQTRRSCRLAREMMITLSKTVDTKDHYTDGHSRRVAALCAEIGRRLGKSESEQILLYEIGLLHDIGKIGIREDIIRKNTRLSDDEFAEVKSHTVKGFEILKHIHDMPKLREGARWHHERFDGSGYPDGLKGDEIPESARIACIADCYDAMTSTRTYSVPKRQEDVRAEIERCKGKWFDPEIADVMLAMIDEDKDYRMNENSSGGDIWKGYERLWEKPDDAELGKSDVIAGKGRRPEMESQKAPEEMLPEWIARIPEIDEKAGLKNCGSVSGYMSVLDVFYKTAGAKADEIESFYDKGDIENYTIKVHALKSSARIIGAAKLSHLAEELESAGKEKNKALITEKTETLLQMYRELEKRLRERDSEEKDLLEIDEKSLKEAFWTISEVSQSMDYEMMENLLGDLRSYRLDERSEGYLKKIEGLLTDLDWEGIAKTAENYLAGSEV